ncbi:hypothetical protein [Algoriphagus sp. Y33]|uniref:hypothetical protein n=1 Tax=Algoriphagus sp. Y33 TaxID=2772483 RepID=UPI001782A33C|nr:hypothetical protein [Algoriphagus sp. Y33]
MRSFRVSDQHAVYFLTLAIVDWIDVFTRKEYKIEVVDSLSFCVERKSIESRATWMLKAFREKGANQSRITNYKFWIDGLHAIAIESNHFFEQKMHYIHQNPVEAMIVEEAEEYLFSSARDYAGKKGLVKVELY